MLDRKYDSGAQKRKQERNKEQRHQHLLRQIPKLTGYFIPAGGSNNPHTEDTDINNNDIATFVVMMDLELQLALERDQAVLFLP